MKTKVNTAEDALKYLVAAELEKRQLIARSKELLEARRKIELVIRTHKKEVKELITRFKGEFISKDLLKVVVPGTTGSETKMYLVELHLASKLVSESSLHRYTVTKMDSLKTVK